MHSSNLDNTDMFEQMQNAAAHKAAKAQDPSDATTGSLVEAQLAETLSKLRWLIRECEKQAERTGQESIHLQSARTKCKQWVACFPVNSLNQPPQKEEHF
jgi:vacuolar-type H+-ATPase subunit E/Vma4